MGKITVMTLEKIIRIYIDSGMIILLLCAYAFQITEATAHIWIGISLFILFSVHVYLNRNWLKAIFKGKYTPLRTVINILLVLAAVTMMMSGILEALWEVSFLQFEGKINIRQIHTTTAYWFWPLTGVHLWASLGNVHKTHWKKPHQRYRYAYTGGSVCRFRRLVVY